jgi:hypothetical protein
MIQQELQRGMACLSMRDYGRHCSPNPRLKTRIRHVQMTEAQLEEKRQHCTLLEQRCVPVDHSRHEMCASLSKCPQSSQTIGMNYSWLLGRS